MASHAVNSRTMERLTGKMPRDPHHPRRAQFEECITRELGYCLEFALRVINGGARFPIMQRIAITHGLLAIGRGDCRSMLRRFASSQVKSFPSSLWLLVPSI